MNQTKILQQDNPFQIPYQHRPSLQQNLNLPPAPSNRRRYITQHVGGIQQQVIIQQTQQQQYQNIPQLQPKTEAVTNQQQQNDQLQKYKLDLGQKCPSNSNLGQNYVACVKQNNNVKIAPVIMKTRQAKEINQNNISMPEQILQMFALKQNPEETLLEIKNDQLKTQDTTQDTTIQLNQKSVEKEYENIMNEDMQNPEKVPHYCKEIFQYLIQREKTAKIPYYFKQQPELTENMRAILIDWLVVVHFSFGFKPETLYLCVYIIDKFLSLQEIKRSRLQLVGITALFIASKYEEIYPPSLSKFSEVTDGSFSKDQITKMEIQIIKALNFQITVPSAFRFAEWYCRINDFDEKSKFLAFYIVELALLEAKFLQYSYSHIAASAIYLVNKINGKNVCWNNLMQCDCGLSETQVKQCAKELFQLLQGINEYQHQSVRVKFSKNEYQNVGRITLNFKCKKDE